MKCKQCTKKIKRKFGEALRAFEKRQFCDKSCAGRYFHPRKVLTESV